MSARTYDRITHSCIITALFAAILFDKIPRFKWLFGTLAVLSGIVAAGVYFCNQWISSEEPKLEDSKAPELSISRIEWHQPPTIFQANDLLTGMLSTEREHLSRSGWYTPHRQVERYLLISKAQQDDFRRHIIQALAPLYSTKPSKEIELECVVTRTGSFVFIVRPASRIRRSSETLTEVFSSTKRAQPVGEWLSQLGATSGAIITTPLEPPVACR